MNEMRFDSLGCSAHDNVHVPSRGPQVPADGHSLWIINWVLGRDSFPFDSNVRVTSVRVTQSGNEPKRNKNPLKDG